MKLLDRLKGCFGRIPNADEPEAVRVPPPSDEGETLSRVARNLSCPEVESDIVSLTHAAQSARQPSEPAPRAADMDELLSYLPKLYPDGVAIKTYVFRGCWPEYFDVVKDFYRVMANECWTDIDYIAHGAAVMLVNETCIAQASLADIQTMLTLCLRGERFCDGHHGSVIEKGYVLNVLKRLAVLREEVGGEVCRGLS